MRVPIHHNCPKALGLIFLMILVTGNSAPASTKDAFISQEFEKKTRSWQGELQILNIRLYTTTSFSGVTRFELPKVPGVIVMESRDRPYLGSEQVDERSYIFKEHEIALFPQRPGSLVIPPFTVTFSFLNAGGSVVEQSFLTKELKLSVEKIPEVDPAEPLITSTSFEIVDHWEPEPGKAKVGDAYTRTITMTAGDLPGMILPPASLKKIKGMGLYAKPPEIEDVMQRGDFTGKRVEKINYICEQEGTFTIPVETFHLWNPENESLQNIILGEVTLQVSANPALYSNKALVVEETGGALFFRKWLGTILLFLGFIGTAFIWQRRKRKMKKSTVTNNEKELYEKFQKASASNDGASTMDNLLHWLDHIELAGRPSTLERFVQLTNNQELATQIKILEKTLYSVGQKQDWSGKKLSRAVEQARKKLMHRRSASIRQGLQPLNP